MLKPMAETRTELQFRHSLPFGPIVRPDGVQFVVYSRNATALRILLYDRPDAKKPSKIIPLTQDRDRWGDVWSILVPGIQAGQLYHLQADGPFAPSQGHRFDGEACLIDPWAQALTGDFRKISKQFVLPPKCVVVDDHFDWEGDRHLRHDLADTIVYEMHVRGFTQHHSSQTQHAGTYLGVIDKIPYLKSLGVTAVELLPIHEFPTNHHDGTNTNKNYWGYDTLNFFSPHRGYAFDQTPGAQVREFKQMVKALHAADIEVILDVVYNHTCEGNHLGPTLSFRGLENSVYYMLENDQQYFKNYSGCGNTVNGNHPVVREMIFHSLRHWAHNYHIDGFRFDLASILSRDQAGNLLQNPPLVEMIAEDPLLSDTKIIAEAWDAAGAYQVGSFGDSERWVEWNGRYRDDVRRFWRGDHHMQGAMATRLSGSSDVYQPSGRPPICSVNFITSHDGFTMNDLVSYNKKHNLANGENNQDGDNNNYSDNHGFEGPTDDPAINAVRTRQIKNLMTTLMLSQGVPMLVAGDECQRTQGGNNNAYCQDNETSWFDWNLVVENSGLVRFTRALIQFRRTQPTVRRTEYLTGEPNHDDNLPDVMWFNADGTRTDWTIDKAPLICWLSAPVKSDISDLHGRDLLILMNPLEIALDFTIPTQAQSLHWSMFVDTSAPAPADIFPMLDGPGFEPSGIVQMTSKSTLVFVSTSELISAMMDSKIKKRTV